MLTSLSIQNVVLIEHLVLEGAEGLCALTGETGAGKSILLDALSLALGARADASLIRSGVSQASVVAVFELPADHPSNPILQERGIENGSELILRRVLSSDGRSKAFINDAPVAVQLLKDVGQTVVEIHGQFATQGLLEPAMHRALLDEYANLQESAWQLREYWRQWKEAEENKARLHAELQSLRDQEEYLTQAVDELQRLAPQVGEEALLAEKRARLLEEQKRSEAADHIIHILDAEEGVLNLLGRVQSLLEKAHLSSALEALSRARAEIEEISYQINAQAYNAEESLEEIEERYFALRACARRHRVPVDALPGVLEGLSSKLKLMDMSAGPLVDAEKAVKENQRRYQDLADGISKRRQQAARSLAAAVQQELPDLKLEKVVFDVEVVCRSESTWGPDGIDHVQFVVATNAGTAPGPLHRLASGGEMSRILLALKVVLSGVDTVPTLIFDEVDSGIGGATADAVGRRLARLAETYQVLVVTHSPQVAARATHHWHVEKSQNPGTVQTVTHIRPLLSIQERQEEIARMLSGSQVTTEARAQAWRLLEKKDAA